MAEASSTGKTVSFAELNAHKTANDLYLLIHGKVYDVSKFSDEHPGGDEVLTAEAGKDATEAFEDVGHSDEAREILKGLYIGEFDGADAPQFKQSKMSAAVKDTTSQSSGGSAVYLLPVAAVGAYLAWRFYLA